MRSRQPASRRQEDPRGQALAGKALPHFGGTGKVVGLDEYCCHVLLLPWNRRGNDPAYRAVVRSDSHHHDTICANCARGVARIRADSGRVIHVTRRRPSGRQPSRSTERSTMTVLPQGSEISRRRLLQFGAAAGFLLGTGGLAGCAGPTGPAGPQHPDPGPQPVPGQPGQQAQPVRRRRHRPARRAPGTHRHRPRNQAGAGPRGPLRDDRPPPRGPSGSAKASATPTAPRSRSRTSPRP